MKTTPQREYADFAQSKPAFERAAAKQERRLSAVILFAFTLFVSASLMFSVQPMFGKTLLPLLGGSPSVWNTCMVFYQSLLFLGYLYAHFIAARLQHRGQIMAHAAVVLISLIALPVELPGDAAPPVETNPTPWLLKMLAFSIGLPFFVVSATAPLLQKWFSAIGHQESHDPYFLYAASNAGSLIALLGYPFLIEPHIGLENQKLFWSIGYGLLAVLVVACAAPLWRTYRSAVEKAPAVSYLPVEAPGLKTMLHWLALTFVPSSLLLGLTNFISTDIASVPLLWIVPLTLYLLSFVIVFSRRGIKTHRTMVAAQPMVLLPFIAYSFINPAILPYWVDLGLHLAAFFLAVMVCHGELAKSRPHARHLTTYYLMISFGGMLGGMFNTFVAPFIFNAVYEYPIMIAAALLLRPPLEPIEGGKWRQRIKDTAFPIAVLAAGLTLYAAADDLGRYLDLIGTALILLAGISYALRGRSLGLAAFTGVLLFFVIGLHGLVSNVLFQERTFFGVLSVRENVLVSEENGAIEPYHELFHGTTKHGAQRLTAAHRSDPLTYYSRPGPIGQLFKEFDAANADWRIGVVGLGAGALACYAKPGQAWDFFEIDPAVVEIARNPDRFTYLKECAPTARMVVGDARLSLAGEPERRYDLLVMDAFSSDAVPVHLLSREALELYFSRLKENGLLAFHITNRHLDLKKVLAGHAKQMRLAALVQEFKPKTAIPLVVDTDWAVLARSEETLRLLKQSRLGEWRKMPLYFDMKPWTDDFTNILGVWK